MKIVYSKDEFTIDLNDLDPKTVGGLKIAIKNKVDKLKGLENDQISLYHNKAKINASDDTVLEDKNIGATNDSKIFVLSAMPKATKVEDDKKSKKEQSSGSHDMYSNNRNNNSMNYNPMNYNNMGTGQPGMGGMEGMQNQMLQKLAEDPQALISMMETQLNFLPSGQREAMMAELEMFKKNPELIKQVFNSPWAQQMMRNPSMMNGMHNPMMNGMHNPMMNSPGMYNPMMGSPMQSPMMNGYGMYNNPHQMYGNPYYGMGNPGMYGQPTYQASPYPNQQAPIDPNGPCSHGFYPLKNVNGKSEQQSVHDVYGQKADSLVDMGFSDKDANIQALVEAKGDISLAIDILTKMTGSK